MGWEENGQAIEKRLGPRDLILNPPGRRHWFRNDGFQDAQFLMVVGSGPRGAARRLMAGEVGPGSC